MSDLHCRHIPIAMAVQLQVEASVTVSWSAVSWRKRSANQPSLRPPHRGPSGPIAGHRGGEEGEGAMFPTAFVCGWAVFAHTCLPAGLPACRPACLIACLSACPPVCLPAGMLACYPSFLPVRSLDCLEAQRRPPSYTVTGARPYSQGQREGDGLRDSER